MDVKQIERLEALLALPGFPFGGPMCASDLCDFNGDCEPIEDSWGPEAREIIAQCVNFMCENGPALLQLARAVNEAPRVEIGRHAHMGPMALVDSDALVGQTVALVPVPVKEEGKDGR